MRRTLAILGAALLALTVIVTAPPAAASPAAVHYRAHVQNIGWQPMVTDGATAGTTGKGLRLEALTIDGAPLAYRAHVQNVGWQPWVREDEMAGTVGRSLRLEALQITLAAGADPALSIQYRAHVQGIGWQPWVADGATAGTTGRSLRVEAVQIRLVTRTTTPTPTTTTSTPAAASDSLVLAGDVGLEPASLDSLTAMGAEHAPVLFVGDLGYGKAADFCTAAKARIAAPILWVQGNHEVAGLNAVAGGTTSDYLKCLPAPSGFGITGDYARDYVADVGARIRVVAISPEMEGRTYKAGTPEYARLAATLDAARTSGRWVVLVMHHTLRTVGLHGDVVTRDVETLAQAKGVRLVVTGHDHDYSRIQTGPLTVIVAGNSGGHSPRELWPQAPDWPLVKAAWAGTASVGHLVVTATDATLTASERGAKTDAVTITR